MEIKRLDIVNLINKIYKQDRIRGKGAPGEGEAGVISSGDRVEISPGSEILKKELARLEKADAARNEKFQSYPNALRPASIKLIRESLPISFSGLLMKVAVDNDRKRGKG